MLDERWFPTDLDFVQLDIGPGDGSHAESWSRQRRVVAVESDERLVRLVAQRAASGQLDPCRGDAHRLPIRTESVDGVTMLEVLEHITEPDIALAEAFRVLRPGGSLCVAVPTSYTERCYARLHPHYTRNAEHVRVFSRDDLCRRIERQGFVVMRLDTRNLEPALAWLVHALLRSDADPTGQVLEHHKVDPMVWRLIRRIENVRLLGRTIRFARKHVGKSWYVFASKNRAEKPLVT